MDYTAIPKQEKEIAQSRFSELVEGNYDVLAQNAYEVNVLLTPHQLSTLSRQLGGFPVRLSETATHRSHPLPAACHEIAAKCVYKSLKHTFLEVGTEFESLHNHDVHLITARDEGRAIKKAPDFADALLSDRHCRNGVLSCAKQAHTLVAIGVHDISPLEWVKAMHKHGAVEGVLAMILPHELDFDTPPTNDPKADPGYRMQFDKDYATMYFPGDPSNGYRHSLKTWRSWRTTTIIKGANHNYIFEETTRIGIVSIIRVYRTFRGDAVLKPLCNPYADHYRIPYYSTIFDEMMDIKTHALSISHLKSRIYKLLMDAKHFYIPKQVYHRAMAFADARTDTMFNRQFIYTFINSIASPLKVNDVHITQDLGLTHEQKQELVINIFLNSAAQRYKQTKLIGAAMNMMGSTADDRSLKSIIYNISPTLYKLFWNTSNYLENGRRMQALMEFFSPSSTETELSINTAPHHHMPVIPVFCDFEHHPADRGQCLRECIKLTATDTMHSYVGLTRAQAIDTIEEEYGAIPQGLVVTDSHAYLNCSASTHCHHGVPYKLTAPKRGEGPIFSDQREMREEHTARYIKSQQTTCNNNNLKTKAIIQAFRDLNSFIEQEQRYYNACAAPLNDHEAWHNKLVTHNIIPSLDDFRDAIYRTTGKIQWANNVACPRCVADNIPKDHIIVLDLGMDAEHKDLIGTQVRILENLQNHPQVAIKIQKYYDSFLFQNPGTDQLMQLLGHYDRCDIPGQAAGEAWFFKGNIRNPPCVDTKVYRDTNVEEDDDVDSGPTIYNNYWLPFDDKCNTKDDCIKTVITLKNSTTCTYHLGNKEAQQQILQQANLEHIASLQGEEEEEGEENEEEEDEEEEEEGEEEEEEQQDEAVEENGEEEEEEENEDPNPAVEAEEEQAEAPEEDEEGDQEEEEEAELVPIATTNPPQEDGATPAREQEEKVEDTDAGAEEKAIEPKEEEEATTAAAAEPELAADDATAAAPKPTETIEHETKDEKPAPGEEVEEDRKTVKLAPIPKPTKENPFPLPKPLVEEPEKKKPKEEKLKEWYEYLGEEEEEEDSGAAAVKPKAVKPKAATTKNPTTKTPTTKSNVIDAKCNALGPDRNVCHCVGADFALGAGIALTIRNSLGAANVKELDGSAGKIKQGTFLHQKEQNTHYFHMVTKPQSNKKPVDHEMMFIALQNVRDHLVKINNTKDLYMPHIGSGIDKLDFVLTRQCIEELFRKTPWKTYVCEYNPKKVKKDAKPIIKTAIEAEKPTADAKSSAEKEAEEGADTVAELRPETPAKAAAKKAKKKEDKAALKITIPTVTEPKPKTRKRSTASRTPEAPITLREENFEEEMDGLDASLIASVGHDSKYGCCGQTFNRPLDHLASLTDLESSATLKETYEHLEAKDKDELRKACDFVCRMKYTSHKEFRQVVNAHEFTTNNTGKVQRIWVAALIALRQQLKEGIKPEKDSCWAGTIYGIIDGCYWGKLDDYEEVAFGDVKWSMDDATANRMAGSFIQSLRTTDRDFKEVHDLAIDNLREHKHKGMICNVKMFNGVAGSGKTASVKKILDMKGLTVVVPYRALKAGYNKDSCAAYTIAKYVSSAPAARVLLDEVYAMHPGFVNYVCQTSEEVYCIGGAEQLMYNDGENFKKKAPDIRPYLSGTIPTKKVSYTVPVDITRWANNAFKYDFKTYNGKIESVITQRGAHPRPDPNKFNMAYSLAVARSKKGKTAASVQGCRTKDTHFFYESAVTTLASVHGMDYVAMTRHSRNIYVYLGNYTEPRFHHRNLRQERTITSAGEGPTIEGRHSIVKGRNSVRTQAGPYELAGAHIEVADRFQVRATVPNTDKQARIETVQSTVRHHHVQVTGDYMVMHAAHTGYEPVGVILPYDEIEPTFEFYDNLLGVAEHQETSFARAEEILQEVAPTDAIPYTENRLNEIHDLGTMRTAKTLTFGLDNKPVNPGEVRNTFTTPGRCRYRHDQTGHFGRTLHCLINRYGGEGTTRDRQLAGEQAEELFTGFMKFIDPTKIEQITPTDIELGVASQVTRIHAKQQDQSDAGTFFEGSSAVRFFLKGQQKVDLNPDGWLRSDEHGVLKAGQGVSALPKHFNHLQAAYVRALEQKVEQALKPGCHLAYGKTKREMHHMIKESEKDTNYYFNFDLSQQDCCKGLWTDLFFARVCEMFGVPKEIYSIEIAAHTNWHISAIGLDAKLDVEDKYQSGSPWTLTSNTLMEIGVVGMSCDFEDVTGAWFQGDDATVIAKTCNPTPYFFPKLKFEKADIGNFCGMLINEGLALDLPRCAAKILNRSFDNQADLDQYMTAVEDWLRIYTNCEEMMRGIALNAVYYEASYNKMSELNGMLVAFAAGKIVDNLHKKNPNLMFTSIVHKDLY